MSYNSYFPVGYQPAQIYYPQPIYNAPQQVVNPIVQQQPQQTQPTQQTQQIQQQAQPVMSGKIWITEKELDQYLVAPNTAIDLWDKNKPVIYVKSADSFGMTSVKYLDYKIRNTNSETPENQSNSSADIFATKDEVNILAEKIEALKSDFDGLSKRSAGRPKKEVNENE